MRKEARNALGETGCCVFATCDPRNIVSRYAGDRGVRFADRQVEGAVWSMAERTFELPWLRHKCMDVASENVEMCIEPRRRQPLPLVVEQEATH